MDSSSLVLQKQRRESRTEARLHATVGREGARGRTQRPEPRLVLFALCLTAWLTGCESPNTFVVLENQYPESTTDPNVVYQAFWQAIAFTPDGGLLGAGLPPGASSDAGSTIVASANVAYVVLAPGWQVASSAPPTSLVVLQSRSGFAVSPGQTLNIAVDDATFEGNCAAGSVLSQEQADFLTGIVFASLFMTVSYDAATCSSSPKSGAGAP